MYYSLFRSLSRFLKKPSVDGTNKIVLHCIEVRKGNFRLKQKEQVCMNRKYQLAGKGTRQVSKMLKQKDKAGGIKIKKIMKGGFN